jgi:hypothetical protein
MELAAWHVSTGIEIMFVRLQVTCGTDRLSVKQPAKRSISPTARSAAPSNNPSASEVIFAAVKIGHYRAPLDACKSEQIRANRQHRLSDQISANTT